VNIPAESQHGKRLKLKNQGMPVYNSATEEKGDLYLILQVQLPENITEAEKKLIKEWKALRDAK
jgi:DnaJ-class molecular chaperone